MRRSVDTTLQTLPASPDAESCKAWLFDTTEAGRILQKLRDGEPVDITLHNGGACWKWSITVTSPNNDCRGRGDDKTRLYTMKTLVTS